MSDSTYTTTLKEAYESLHTNKSNVSTLFCTFTQGVTALPEPDEETQKKVKALFQDINTQIDLYDRQYNILKQELGVLCPSNPQGTSATQFFEALLTLFRLAYTTFQGRPELDDFRVGLTCLTKALQTNTFQLEEEPYQNALLLQLTKSAWASTKNPLSMQLAGKQLAKGGRNKTRKQKNKQRR
jgi:hypothetical protein